MNAMNISNLVIKISYWFIISFPLCMLHFTFNTNNINSYQYWCICTFIAYICFFVEPVKLSEKHFRISIEQVRSFVILIIAVIITVFVAAVVVVFLLSLLLIIIINYSYVSLFLCQFSAFEDWRVCGTILRL